MPVGLWRSSHDSSRDGLSESARDEGKKSLSARGEIRTRTGLPPVDFESTASAVPPLGRPNRIYRKDLEGTRTETRGFEGADAARVAVERAIVLYRSKFGGS